MYADYRSREYESASDTPARPHMACVELPEVEDPYSPPVPSSPPAAHLPPAGQSHREFRLSSYPIGWGSYSTVCAATDASNKVVCLKIIHKPVHSTSIQNEMKAFQIINSSENRRFIMEYEGFYEGYFCGNPCTFAVMVS